MTHSMTSLKGGLLVAAASVAFTTLPSGAADYPARPIRIIVGFAAGGAPDTLARVVGDKLAQRLGSAGRGREPDRRAGRYRDGRGRKSGCGRLHAGLMPVGNAAVNPSLIPDLPYDPVKDFAPITQIATVEKCWSSAHNHRSVRSRS